MRGKSLACLGAVALWLGAGPAWVGLDAAAQTPAARAPALEGSWRSGDSTIRITVKGSEARGTFVVVGEQARALGFKPGERSFLATVEGSLLYGRLVIRYGGSCYLSGRQVPMMGWIAPDGRVLAMNLYTITVDQNCRDTGRYNISETRWERVAEGKAPAPQRPGSPPSQ